MFLDEELGSRAILKRSLTVVDSDNSEDIGEAEDLAAKHPEKLKELETLWQSWNRELAKPLW